MSTGTADARPADVHELAAHPVGHDMLTCQVQRPPVVLKPAWVVILEVLVLAEVEHNAHNNRMRAR